FNTTRLGATDAAGALVAATIAGAVWTRLAGGSAAGAEASAALRAVGIAPEVDAARRRRPAGRARETACVDELMVGAAEARIATLARRVAAEVGRGGTADVARRREVGVAEVERAGIGDGHICRGVRPARALAAATRDQEPYAPNGAHEPPHANLSTS